MGFFICALILLMNHNERSCTGVVSRSDLCSAMSVYALIEQLVLLLLCSSALICWHMSVNDILFTSIYLAT